MDAPILTSRRELLKKTQNADGGWGYFAGKQSWLEPTAYAMIALAGDAEAAPALDRAWHLVRGWQGADGGWRPAAHVSQPSWVTAFGVLLSTLREEHGRVFQSGVRWLLRTNGSENAWLNRAVYLLTRQGIGRDTSNRGWPWCPHTTAWVEPTALSLIALKRAAGHYQGKELQDRVREGEELLLTVRGRDGGWNYGSAAALGVDLPSYPETTALALLGLQQRAPGGFTLGHTGHSRLADAWLAIAGIAIGTPREVRLPEDPPADLMIAALEAIAAPGGNSAIFKTETVA